MPLNTMQMSPMSLNKADKNSLVDYKKNKASGFWTAMKTSMLL